MRYYDYDYVKELKASLNKIYDSVDPTYTNSFNNLSSEDSVVTKLKNDCIGTAHSAENRITVLRKRYIRLVSIWTKFYSDVDISASETYKMALDEIEMDKIFLTLVTIDTVRGPYLLKNINKTDCPKASKTA